MARVVISASRRTDIPAFYMPWFMRCINQGHFKVINPYNRQTYTVPAATDQVHSVVFWSKNFGPFLSRGYGDALTGMGYRLFFNFTINSPHRVLEPMMPALEDRLTQMTRLAEKFGPQCIQWRFDPICFYKTRSGRQGDNLDQFDTIARRVADAGVGICITSYADIYRKVAQRMEKHSELQLIDPPMDRKRATIERLCQGLTPMGIELKLCCEKEVLSALPEELPVTAAGCIPNDRLMRLYGPGISLARDRGQRISTGCSCYVSKDIGSYAMHPCNHNCLFCYANPAIDGMK